MLNKEAIESLQEAAAIEQVKRAVAEAVAHDHTLPVAFPASMSLHDLQKYMPYRRRLGGEMRTTSADHFAHYAQTHAEGGATVFVNAENMTATGVLNFGGTDAPGHADNLVHLQLIKSAPYKALLLASSDNERLNQRTMAEWLEDNLAHIKCYNSTEEIKPAIAIAAIRNVTIEQLNKVDSTVESLSQERSAFEQIKATSKHTLPTLIYFTCEPYIGLPERTFVCRFGLYTGGNEPRITLRIINYEQHTQDMAQDAVQLLADKLGSDYPLYVGTYQKA